MLKIVFILFLEFGDRRLAMVWESSRMSMMVKLISNMTAPGIGKGNPEKMFGRKEEVE